jgi:hypothetical protein
MLVGLELARLDEVFDLGDRHLAGGGHHRIEVSRGLAVDEIALGIALPGVDDRHISHQAPLHNIILAVEAANLLAVGDDGADTRLGEESGYAGAAGPDALGERALRGEFKLEFAGERNCWAKSLFSPT